MSVHQFRRFTFFVTIKNQVVSEIAVQFKTKNIQNELKRHGVLNFEIYQKDQECFLIIDTATNNNCLSLRDVFSNLDIDFQKFFKEGNSGLSIEESPLERIYELDQKVVYTPQEGQLKNRIGAKKRFVWTLLLEEDSNLMAEYKKVHSIGQAWPEITANMKTVGVKDMEIYLHNTQAILIMDTKPDFDLEEIGPKWQQLPRETEWQEFVAKFQRTDLNSSIQEKWQDMKNILSN